MDRVIPPTTTLVVAATRLRSQLDPPDIVLSLLVLLLAMGLQPVRAAAFLGALQIRRR